VRGGEVAVIRWW